jgi:hypothetical protein
VNFEDGIRNEKRAKKVITWSAIYLVTSWLSILAEILNPNSDDFKITDLLYFFVIPALTISIVFTWHWLRSVVISAQSIDSNGIGYRQGWAFWGWVTPLACWWVPRRLVDRSQKVFTSYLGEVNSLQLGVWWGFWVASGIVDTLNFRASMAESEGAVYLSILSAILLTIAFPKWKFIVETVSKNQRNVLAKVQTESA